MALIKCIECGYEISDKSEKCIKCGCPTELSIPRNGENTCLINGHPYDLSEFLPLLTDPDMTISKMKVINDKIRQKTGLAASMGLCNQIMKTKKIPEKYNGQTLEDMAALEAKRVHCKYCGSTNVKKLRNNFYNLGNQWHCNNCGSDF